MEIKQIAQYDTNTRENSNRFRVYDTNGLAPTLGCMGGGGREPRILKVCNINPSGKGMNGNVFDSDYLCPTLTTNKGEGIKILIKNGTKKGYLIADDGDGIRKLTPKECWRLMGCSDEDFHKAEQVNSNSQLYKQAGNAIVVDVLEAIFKQMFLK